MAGLALLGAEVWVVWGGSALPQSIADGPATEVGGASEAVRPSIEVAGELQPTAEWFDLIFGAMRPRREERSEPRPRARPRSERPRKTESASYASGSYRTLCVRLCDGFYFPISYATGRDNFAGDAGQCERQCPARSRLFVYRNPGEEIEDMRDLEGRKYLALPTALVYRTLYVADCTCRGNPWDEAEQIRHRAYARGEVPQSMVEKAGAKH